MRSSVYCISSLLLLLGFVFAQDTQTADDEKVKIVETALNYIDGWYTGDAERMEKALHPHLAKRMVSTDKKSGRSNLHQMTAMSLVQGTRKSWGKEIPEVERQNEVIILDVFRNAASVKVIATDWIDYLHIVKWKGEWKIINVLWELKEKKQ